MLRSQPNPPPRVQYHHDGSYAWKTTVRSVYVHGQRTPARPPTDSREPGGPGFHLAADSRRQETLQSFGILHSLSSQLPIALTKARVLAKDLASKRIHPNDRSATIEADKAHLSLIDKNLG